MKTEDKVLSVFIDEMQSRLGDRLKEILLFGSRARGDNAVDSDYDCLLIVDKASREVEDIVDEVAGELLYRYDAVFSIFPVSETQYREQKYNPLFMNIRNDGVAV
jgi:predicted nucleotidyltransferase